MNGPREGERKTRAPCPRGVIRDIDRLVVDALKPRRQSLVWEHVRDCEACRRRYNRAALSARLLHGGPAALAAPTDAELERAFVGVRARTRIFPDAAKARLRLFAALATAAAAVLVVALVLPFTLKGGAGRGVQLPGGHEASAAQDELTRRGEGDSRPAVGLRAFCIRSNPGANPEEVAIVDTRMAGQPADPSTCQLSDVLRFAVTNRSELGYVFLFGLDSSFDIKWYAPTPPQTQSIAIGKDEVDHPLHRAVDLHVNHRPGILRILAIFSTQPLAAGMVAENVKKWQQAGLDLRDEPSLLIPGTEQRSVDVMLIQ